MFKLWIMILEGILALALEDLSELQCMLILSAESRLIPGRNFELDVIYSETFRPDDEGGKPPYVVFVMEIRRSMATKVFVIAIAITDCE
jgi:hypothetical protein